MINIQSAKIGVTYPAHMLPAFGDGKSLSWVRLGDDEQYNVTILNPYSPARVIKVVECTFNDDLNDWEDTEVNPNDVDLTVVLP